MWLELADVSPQSLQYFVVTDCWSSACCTKISHVEFPSVLLPELRWVGGFVTCLSYSSQIAIKLGELLSSLLIRVGYSYFLFYIVLILCVFSTQTFKVF